VLHVRVRNFQSIRDGEFVIDGFTVVTGTNNLGKSALYRAVKGVFTNPAATFTRDGQKLTTVEISDEGRYVKWEKGPKESAVYTLKVDGEESVFENVGQKCPDKVLEAFGIGTLQAGTSALWPQFADQFTGPLFLLDKTGSAIADAVANVERIQTLNRALKACESDKRSTVANLKVRKKDQEAIELKLARFDGLDGIVLKIKKVEADREKAERLKSGHKKLTTLKRQYETAKAQVELLVDFDPKVPEADTAGETAKDLAETRRLRARLGRSRRAVEAVENFGDVEAFVPSQEAVTALTRLQDGRRKIRQIRDRVVPLQEAVATLREAAEVAQGLKPDLALEVKARQIQQVVKLLRALRSEMVTSHGQVDSCDTELAECVAELETLEAELGEALESYDDCPLCGVAIGHVHPDAELA